MKHNIRTIASDFPERKYAEGRAFRNRVAIRQHLETIGATGLVFPSEGCGCQLDDLFPCDGDDFEFCTPAYAVLCDGSLGCHNCDVPGEGVCSVSVELIDEAVLVGAAVSLRRELIVTPADGPAGVFYLIFRVWGPGGVIQVKVMSYWFPPIEMVNSNLPLVVASDSSCHAYEPQFDGNESAECTLLEGGRCYLGHDFFMPRDAERILLDEGSEGVFRELEASYRQLLGKEAAK